MRMCRYFRPACVCTSPFDGRCKNAGSGPERRERAVHRSSVISDQCWSSAGRHQPTPTPHHHWDPLAFQRASSPQSCACKVFSKSNSRWLGLPGGGVSGVRGLMRDNWFSAAPCRDAGQQNSWNLKNVKNKPSRSGFICRSASTWNEKLLFLFSFSFQCPKRALPGKSHGLKCQIAWGSGGWSWWSRVATAQKHKKSTFNRKKKKEQTLNQC